jgi:hypothetical protein
MGLLAHPFACFISRRYSLIKRHRTLLVTLLILFIGMFVSIFACCATFIEYYANRDASTQVNGYRIDFEYDFAMDVNVTRLKITRPDGKARGLCSKYRVVVARG